MEAYAEPEILGDEWVAEPLPPALSAKRSQHASPRRMPSTTTRRDRSRRRPVARRPAARRPALSRQGRRRRRRPATTRCCTSRCEGLSTGRPAARRRARLHARRRADASRRTTPTARRRARHRRRAAVGGAAGDAAVRRHAHAPIRAAATAPRSMRCAAPAWATRRSSRWRSSSPSSPTSSASSPACGRCARPRAARTRMIRRNGFTDESLEWRSWLAPVQLADASPLQLEVLDESHPQSRTLALLPDAGAPASHAAPPLGGLQRDHVRARRPAARRARAGGDGRLGDATAASTARRCTRSASSSSRTAATRSSRCSTIRAPPGTSERERAIARFALAVTERPEALGADDIAPLTRARHERRRRSSTCSTRSRSSAGRTG